MPPICITVLFSLQILSIEGNVTDNKNIHFRAIPWQDGDRKTCIVY